MNSYLRNLSITQKILFALLASNLIGGLALSIHSVQTTIHSGDVQVQRFREESIVQSKNQLRQLVESSISLLAHYDSLAVVGSMSKDSAQLLAIEAIKTIRYDQGRGYFWINDMGEPIPKMIMHATKSSLDGKVLDKPAFNCALGKKQNLFQAMVEVCKANGLGFVGYIWPDPKDMKKELPKLSYVELFKPWGMVVGTGIYIDEIDAAEAKLREKVNLGIHDMIVEQCAVAFLVLLLVGGGCFILARQLGDRLNSVARQLHDISDGDGNLIVRLDDTTNDEAGRIAQAFDKFMGQLSQMISKVGNNTDALYRISEYLSDNSTAMAQVTEQINAKSKIVVSNAEEASQNISEIADSVGTLSQGTASVSKAIAEMRTTLQDIARHCADESRLAADANLQSKDVSVVMEQLDQAVSEIGKVVDTINDIAEQTNLLALNANIEAATAGEAGKGFAVVANEVKVLARQTAEATQSIEGSIGAIQQRTRKAMDSIALIIDLIRQLDLVSQSIVAAVEEETVTANSVARDTQENSKAAEIIARLVQGSVRNLAQVGQSIHEVSLSAKSSVTGMGDVQKKSQDLKILSLELQGMVQKFKV